MGIRIPFFIMVMMVCLRVNGQQFLLKESDRAALLQLVTRYSTARQTNDTVLLKRLLTANVDQLVSTGEWRVGLPAAVAGMMESAATNPGSRSLVVEKVKLIGRRTALVDCRYQIMGASGPGRLMHSTMIVVKNKGNWKIAAIRNMLPAK